MSKVDKEELCKLHKDEYLVQKESPLVEVNEAKNPADNDHYETDDDEFMARIGIFYMICSPVFISP